MQDPYKIEEEIAAKIFEHLLNTFKNDLDTFIMLAKNLGEVDGEKGAVLLTACGIELDVAKNLIAEYIDNNKQNQYDECTRLPKAEEFRGPPFDLFYNDQQFGTDV